MTNMISNMYIVLTTLIVAALVTANVNDGQNEWLTLAKNAQNSIKGSISKVKSYEGNEEGIILATDKAFDDFVKYVKNGVTPIMEKVKKPSDVNTRIKTKLTNWIAKLESLNNVTDSSKRTVQNSLNKFESTIQSMVDGAPQFGEKMKSATSENREILLEIGTFMKKVINKLADNMKGVKVNDEENEWLTLAKNTQNSIKGSISKVKSYKGNEEGIKIATDKAFDDFVKYVKNGVTPIMEKIKKPSDVNTRIKTKLTNWIAKLESLNNVTDSSKRTVQNSLSKFESTIQSMVDGAPQFGEKMKSATSENREILLEIGTFMKEVLNKLADNMKGVKVNDEENEWLTLARKSQNSIKGSILEVKRYEGNEEDINLAIDKAFDDFVKFVKNGVIPITEKIKKPSNLNTRIKTRLTNWIAKLESLNNVTDSSKRTVQNSLNKFENTIQSMVDGAPQFGEKMKSATSENREILLEIGTFMKEVLNKLADNMKGVEGQFKKAKKIAQVKTKTMA